MSLKPLFEDDYWDVQINWSKPRFYENVAEYGAEHNDEAYLYMITAKYGTKKSKILYIGKTYKQTVCNRLNQDDHRIRYENFQKKYPRHKLYVSYGTVKIRNGKTNENRIKEIEKILIYSNDTEHAQNISNIYSHSVKDSYKIKNSGYKCTLPNQLYLGIFAK